MGFGAGSTPDQYQGTIAMGFENGATPGQQYHYNWLYHRFVSALKNRWRLVSGIPTTHTGTGMGIAVE